jgi:putative transposase
MPWDKTDAMKERVKFVLEWERRWKATHGGSVDMAELCRMFGISRPTGYLWIARYRDAGHDVDFIVDARKARPRWAHASCARG